MATRHVIPTLNAEHRMPVPAASGVTTECDKGGLAIRGARNTCESRRAGG